MLRSLTLSIVLCLCGCLPAAVGDPPDNARMDLERWISELDSSSFSAREEATNRLRDAGVAAIEPIVKHIGDGSLEVTARCVMILQELALDADLATQQQAQSALEELAQSPTRRVALRAQEATARLADVRQQAATRHLTLLGARIQIDRRNQRDPRIAVVPTRALIVEIDDQWKGTDDDLVWLRWLRDAESVWLGGEHVKPGWFDIVAQLPNVRELIVSRAAIGDDAVKRIGRLPNLFRLGLLYCPITDLAVDDLIACKRTHTLWLFGTKITAAGVAKITDGMPQMVELSVKAGAFLGVSCFPQTECIIQETTPGSAAALAGLDPQDQIVGYQGKRVRKFEELAPMIGENQPGDEVAVDIIKHAERRALVIVVPGPLPAITSEDHVLGCRITKLDQAKNPPGIDLKVGDVIIACNSQEIASSQDFQSVVAKRKAGDPLALRVTRGALRVPVKLGYWEPALVARRK